MDIIRIDNLQDKQECAFLILEAFDKFCTKNSLNYSLAGGTLLGAIRHGDFIPWDDDVDVLMPREDYDKFFAMCKGYIGKHYRAVQNENVRYAYFAYGKVYDDRTIIDEGIAVPTKIGIYIDIFPVDGLPDRSVLQENHIRRIKRYQKIVNYRTMKYKKGKTILSTLIKYIVLTFVRLFFSLDKSVEKIDLLARTYNFQSSVFCAPQTLNYGMKEVMPKKYFTEYERKSFHGREFNVIKQYDYYLTKLYGDYMELPPVEKRVQHSYSAYRIINEQEE